MALPIDHVTQGDIGEALSVLSGDANKQLGEIRLKLKTQQPWLINFWVGQSKFDASKSILLLSASEVVHDRLSEVDCALGNVLTLYFPGKEYKPWIDRERNYFRLHMPKQNGTYRLNIEKQDGSSHQLTGLEEIRSFFHGRQQLTTFEIEFFYRYTNQNQVSTTPRVTKIKIFDQIPQGDVLEPLERRAVKV